MVGLSNVDNTSYLNKPVSTATQTALNLKANSYHVVGRLFAVGTIDKHCGQNALSGGNINNSSAGTYVFTIPAHPNGGNYMVLVTPSASGGGAFFSSTHVASSTSFTVYIYNSSGT